VVTEEHADLRLDKVIPGFFEGVSRATVQRWIAEGRVRLDGVTCRGRDEVHPGSVIEVEPGDPPPTDVKPDTTVPFTVLHEDDDVIVVDKPAGVVVHPGKGNWEHTLVAGLLSREGFSAPHDPRDPAGTQRPGIVHRIDKNTSGALVVAKSARAHESLRAQLAAHTVLRVYRALTLGVPKPGRIETLYGRHRTSRLRFTSLTDQGKSAVTNVTVDEAFGGGRAALISCRLETGRTHQIRVHLAERTKTPILADALYGRVPKDEPLASIAKDMGRQALHAEVLGFEHPASGEQLRFEAKIPDDFARALERLRAVRPVPR
jgi:23S rRNA pseudouridine1911/1915/1917 synthase